MNKRGYSASTPKTEVLIRFMKSFSSAQNSFSSPEPLANQKKRRALETRMTKGSAGEVRLSGFVCSQKPLSFSAGCLLVH